MYVVVEAAHLMGESFSTPLPCAYKRSVTFMEGFNVHFQVKRLQREEQHDMTWSPFIENNY